MRHTITDLDNDQIVRYSYDPEHQAQRVVLTGDFGIAEAIKSSLKDIKIDVGVNNNPEPSTVQVIEVPKIIQVTETKIQVVEVEKQIILKEIEYREIEKPVIIRETEVIRVEVPIVQKEIQIIEIDKQSNDKIFKILQLTLMAIIAIALFIK